MHQVIVLLCRPQQLERTGPVLGEDLFFGDVILADTSPEALLSSDHQVLDFIGSTATLVWYMTFDMPSDEGRLNFCVWNLMGD